MKWLIAGPPGRRVRVAVTVLRLGVVVSALLLAGVGLLGEDRACELVVRALAPPVGP